MVSTNSSDPKRSVAELCHELVNNHFDKYPFVGRFSLEDFKESEGLLAGLQKIPIPRDPTNPEVPALLLYDLLNEDHKKTAAYDFIENTSDICSGLYGTSGAGKTRSIYEYLSHNFGLFFTAKTTNDFGSRDLETLIKTFARHHAEDVLDTVEVEGDSQETDYKEQRRLKRVQRNEKNLARMERYVTIMYYIRRVVLDTINKKLKDRKEAPLTPYDWLLVQLCPKQALGKDLFNLVLGRCLIQANKDKTDTSVSDDIVLKCEEWDSFLMVVDEAQVLLKTLTNFFLNKNGKKERAAFSGVLKAMSNIPELLQSDVGFPLIAGTGMALDEIKEASGSLMGKRPNSLLKNRTTIFKDFKPLDAAAVERYLLKFLKLDVDKTVEGREVPNSCVISHVSKWLRGRPRWAASFLELYLCRPRNGDHVGTRGSFSSEGALLIQALDRYIDNYTQGSLEELGGGNRRKSYDPPEGTAYSGIKRVVDECDDYKLTKRLELAIFKFAVGGQPVYISEHYATLIEVGVAALSYTTKSVAVLDEPIIIQAGINYFSLDGMVIESMIDQNKGGLGDGFEKVVLPAIQRKFSEILEKQLGDEGDVLKKYTVPKRSAYGMLALQCKSPAETIQWIDDATKSTFEGQVPPFCYPDEAIGPDLIFLMWDDGYTMYISVIAQAKYREKFNQMDALRTITPSLLYHQSRGKEKEQVSKMITSDGDLKTRWEDAKLKLVGDKHGCVRFMVQYPSYKTASADSGVLEDDKSKVEKGDKQASKNRIEKADKTPTKLTKNGNEEVSKTTRKLKKRKLGWLTTISMDTAPELFHAEDLDVLNVLKET